MNKTLIITEKPSVAKDIAKSLGGFSTGKEAFLGKEAVITWAVGHLVTLAEPEDYDKKYRFWALESLPIIPERFQLKVIKSSASRFAVVAKLLQNPDVTEVINACDAGREGELIFRYIYEKTGCTKPIRRLWLSSMTTSAIREGFNQLRPGPELESLAHSAKCRSESDWLIGINATRAFTRRFGTLLSVGRVQTPTLAILVNRELEILAFVPEKYWELFATFQAPEGAYLGKWFTRGRERFLSEAEGQEIMVRLEGFPGKITSLEKKESQQLPPLLFDLAELQREANRRFGFYARRTLDVAQSLYERHKLLTYPRTDCQYLSSDMIPQLPAIVRTVAVGDWQSYCEELLAKPGLPTGRRIIDDSKITDHHAIIPTLTPPHTAALSVDERRVYDLVVRRFLAVFYPPARWENTRLVTEVREEKFRTEGRRLLEAGWLEVYDRPGRDELLPNVHEGEDVQVKNLNLQEKETVPPPRYNDASLLSAMEGAGKLLEDEELRQAMKERGLGTAATRAAIIERLIEVDFVGRDGKTLVPTPKGIELIRTIEAIPLPELASPELTGNWERKLVQIEHGQFAAPEFMQEIESLTREVVEKVRNTEDISAMRQAINTSLGSCPLCGGEVRETKMAYSCANWKEQGCKFAIWKRTAGKVLTRTQAETLLKGAKLGPLAGFRSRAGKHFSATLVLKEGKVAFEFAERPAFHRSRTSTKTSTSKPGSDVGVPFEGTQSSAVAAPRKTASRRTTAVKKPKTKRTASRAGASTRKTPARKATPTGRTASTDATPDGPAPARKALVKKTPTRARSTQAVSAEKASSQPESDVATPTLGVPRRKGRSAVAQIPRSTDPAPLGDDTPKPKAKRRKTGEAQATSPAEAAPAGPNPVRSRKKVLPFPMEGEQ